MFITTKRFGLPYNPQKEKRIRNKIPRQIIRFLILFILVGGLSAVGVAKLIQKHISCMTINEAIDATWIGSLASYWGGIIGGIFSGVFAFLGVFYTIKYYRESDERKDRAAIQPFLFVTMGSSREEAVNSFAIRSPSDEKKGKKKFNVTIKNIGNGFANILVIYNGYTLGGHEYSEVILVGETRLLSLEANPDDLINGVKFGLRYIDSMRNEYIQEYTAREVNGRVEIENGYPGFLEQ